jgi:hypothetical protein
MPLIRTSQPTDAQPLSITEVKDHLRNDESDQDSWISAAIDSVTDAVQEQLHCQIMKCGFRYDIGGWRWRVDLPRPVVDTESVLVKYLDTAGDEQTLDAEKYEVVVSGLVTTIILREGTYPTLSIRHTYPVRFYFDAGHATKDDVLPGMKMYLKTLIGYWHMHREALTPNGLTDQIHRLSFYAKSYRRRYFK